MWRAFCACVVFLLGWVGSASAGEPLYQTFSYFLGDHYRTADAAYVFIAPYLTSVETTLSVSIAKTTASGSAANSGNKAASPLVLRASWSAATNPPPPAPGQPAPPGTPALTTYRVSCDLTSLLFPGDQIAVTQITPADWGKQNEQVQSVTATDVVVLSPNDPSDGGKNPYSKGGVISGVSCPPAPDPFAVTFQVAPKPKSRGFLYLRRNDFFSDSVNVSVGTDGMLSSSDTSSVQQITAILTELAQTAAPFIGAKAEAPADETRAQCYKAITDFVKSAPFYDTLSFEQITNGSMATDSQTNKYTPSSSATGKVIPSRYAPTVLTGSTVDWSIPVGEDAQTHKKISVHLKLTTMIDSLGQAVSKTTSHIGPGLVAFFPVPATAAMYCSVGDTGDATTKNTLLSLPTVVNLYTYSKFLVPVRDFLTGPQDTYTFSGGFITGHKYSNQSSAKTIVDTITAPIRAIMPSVTVTQTTQVQSNASGAVTSTTSTNQTQTAPSKGP